MHNVRFYSIFLDDTEMLRPISSETKLSEVVVVKFFKRTFSLETFRKLVSSLRNFSAKSFREIIYLPCELVVLGDSDVVRFAST